MDRPFKEAGIDQLEQVFEKHKHKRPVLARLRAELQRRNRPRAKQLLKEIEAVLDGTIPLEEPVPEDSLDYQMTIEDLLDEEE